MRLVQLQGPEARRVALVEEPQLRLLHNVESVHALAQECLRYGVSLQFAVERSLSTDMVDYEGVYKGASAWRLLPPLDHPTESSRCLVSGTGLTHSSSAKNRDAMHAKEEQLTDSMRMYRWGIEGGRPEAGAIGVAPEWFYKGTGSILRAHNEPLTVPAHAEDGGEEAEIAGLYVIDDQGKPRRVGLAAANEFSDHVLERRNYLYLAASKLRDCAVGPEVLLNCEFERVSGTASVERNGQTVWSRAIQSGETAMCHSLANLEHHHFKFAAHRRPGDVHIHFFGADAFSFGEGVKLQEGDVMQVAWEGLGRPLRNRLQISRESQELVRAEAL
jgi:hypothetical protein